jgi:phosphate transport system permease protein
VIDVSETQVFAGRPPEISSTPMFAPPARTHLPVREAEPADAPQTARAIGRTRREDVFRVLGAAAAGIATTTWLFTQVAPFSGVLPFLLISYLLFVAYYAILVRFDERVVGVKDKLATVVFHSIAVLLLLALVDVVIFTVVRSVPAITHLNFWTQDLTKGGPLDPLTVGGMLHAVVGTLIIIAIALAIAIPLGLLCAIFLAEFPGPFSRIVRTVVEAMTALPSIVCGLFIFATWILLLGNPTSGFAAALSVTIMILPIIIRSADVVLRLVPGSLKEASFGLGASHWKTVVHVLLPSSRAGLMTAIILGTARGIGETSPILLTSGYTTFYNFDPLSGPMTSLPLATFLLVKQPSDTQIARGFGAAVVLMVLVFVLFLVARIIGGRGAGQLSGAGLQRARASSRAMHARFITTRAARAALPVAVRAPSPGETT